MQSRMQGVKPKKYKKWKQYPKTLYFSFIQYFYLALHKLFKTRTHYVTELGALFAASVSFFLRLRLFLREVLRLILLFSRPTR